MKSKTALLFGFCLFIGMCAYCSNDTVSPETGDQNVEAKIYQSSKCLDQEESKISSIDSSFSYTFSDDSLIMDLIVIGNCCPDSDRFASSYYISTDTIYAAVTDTAEELCRCNCPYQIHFEVTGLMLDQYVFCCDVTDMKYVEVVHK